MELCDSAGMLDTAFTMVASAQLIGAAILSETFLGSGTTLVPEPITM